MGPLEVQERRKGPHFLSFTCSEIASLPGSTLDVTAGGRGLQFAAAAVRFRPSGGAPLLSRAPPVTDGGRGDLRAGGAQGGPPEAANRGSGSSRGAAGVGGPKRQDTCSSILEALQGGA